MAIKKDQHVMPTGDRWGVRSTGADRSSKVFDTKELAVKYARDIAKNSQTDLYVHGKDGLVVSKNSYASKKPSENGQGQHEVYIVKIGTKNFGLRGTRLRSDTKGVK
jgi:hypothetical protein